MTETDDTPDGHKTMFDFETLTAQYNAGEISWDEYTGALQQEADREERDNAAKLTEVEEIIASLHIDLDSCPNRGWESEGNLYRLGALIRYSRMRDQLLSA